MYRLILVEAAVELIPGALWRHPSVRRYAERRDKAPGELLLDVSYHFAAMRGLLEREKRGRPDIAHFCLLEALGSPLARRGVLKVYVHTREGTSIRISSQTKLPRNYERFSGLFEKVLTQGRAPPGGEPLLEAKKETLSALTKSLDAKEIFLMRESSPRIPLRKLADLMQQAQDAVILVGGFQHGDFNEQTASLTNAQYSIYPEPLEAWTVVSRVLGALEERHRLFV